MNRSGYFWHELDNISWPTNTSENPIAKMTREISADSHPSISAMRTYEQYNYVFMRGNGDYILAIRNLNDPRTDGSGRSLKQNVIFEDEDRELLLKLLAFYLTSSADFEQWITGECFKPGQNDAFCKLVPFTNKIEELKKSSLHPILKDCEFAVSSLKSAEWLEEKLELKHYNVAECLNKLDAMPGTQFLIPSDTEKPPVPMPISDTVHQLQQEKQQPQVEKQQLQQKLLMTEEELKKWRLYAITCAVIAGGSILLLIFNALKH